MYSRHMYVSVYLIKRNKNPTIIPYRLERAHFSLLRTNMETVKKLCEEIPGKLPGLITPSLRCLMAFCL